MTCKIHRGQTAHMLRMATVFTKEVLGSPRDVRLHTFVCYLQRKLFDQERSFAPTQVHIYNHCKRNIESQDNYSYWTDSRLFVNREYMFRHIQPPLQKVRSWSLFVWKEWRIIKSCVDLIKQDLHSSTIVNPCTELTLDSNNLLGNRNI